MNNRRTGAENTGAVGVKAMLADVAGNKALIALVIAECIKYARYYMFTYQYTYVLGSLNLMTITLTGMGLISVIAAATAPFFIKLFGGRKRSFIIMMFIYSAVTRM